MEIKELPDYVIYFPAQGVFMAWGKMKEKEDGSWEYGWGAVQNDAHATTGTYSEAEGFITQIQKLYGGIYEIRPREKSGFTVTKA